MSASQAATAASRPVGARPTTSQPASAGRKPSETGAAMSQSLLLARRFAPLFWCQFFAALNDNLLKNALAMFVLFRIGGEGGASLVTLATATLMAPYFFLSALGGELADKFDKGEVTRRLKLAEIGAAAIAIAGFYAGLHPDAVLRALPLRRARRTVQPGEIRDAAGLPAP